MSVTCASLLFLLARVTNPHQQGGVNWVDEEVVMDDKLITSRSPKDLPVFCKKMIEEISQRIPVSLNE